MIYCSINGIETPNVAANDRGLAFGDGLFTTGLIEQGELTDLNAHLERLEQGSMQLGIPKIPRKELISYINAACFSHQKAVIKITITAGLSHRGYARDKEAKPTCIVMVSDFPAIYDTLRNTGITLGVSAQKIGLSKMLSGLKHLNRLEQVMIKEELSNIQYDDILVLNIKDEVIESSSSNFFYYADGAWFTPDVSYSGVDGLMRQKILNSINGINVKSTFLADLENASAMFVCNSVSGIIPVYCYKDKKLSMDVVFTFKDKFNDS
ncbi:MAG: aminodeoxychorismate lyase [Colwellia sp.]